MIRYHNSWWAGSLSSPAPFLDTLKCLLSPAELCLIPPVFLTYLGSVYLSCSHSRDHGTGAYLSISSASGQAQSAQPAPVQGWLTVSLVRRQKHTHKWLRGTPPPTLECLFSYRIPSEDTFCSPTSKAVMRQSFMYCWLQPKVSGMRFSLCLL